MVRSFEDDIKLSAISFHLNKKLLIPELFNRIYFHSRWLADKAYTAYLFSLAVECLTTSSGL